MKWGQLLEWRVLTCAQPWLGSDKDYLNWSELVLYQDMLRLPVVCQKEKQANMEMIYTRKKDYHNKQQMNKLLIIQSWEEIIRVFKEAGMLKKWSSKESFSQRNSNLYLTNLPRKYEASLLN